MQRVLIVGGGTGGTMLANTLDKRRFTVTMLSASAQHLFQPGLLYMAFQGASARLLRHERSLLRRHVKWVQDRAVHIDLSRRVVRAESGAHFEYDALVLATGIVTDPSQIPGLAEVNAQFGDYHSTVAQARKLWAALNSFSGGTIVLGQSSPLCKCPPSPAEGILLAEEFLRKKGLRNKARLVFFTPYPRAYPAEPMNDVIEPILKKRGIEIFPIFDLDRMDPATRTIFSIEGDQIQYDLPIIIPPFTGADIAYEPASVVDESRLVITDRASLRVKGVEGAFALGDGTNLPTSKAGVGAHLEAKVIAKALAGEPASFDGRTHCPVDLGGGLGTFVIGSYTERVAPYAPSRIKHWMKKMMAHIYWLSLRGTLEPVFDWYFARTAPEKLAERLARHSAGKQSPAVK